MSIVSFSLLIVIGVIISSCSCWVFNNVNYAELGAKSIDMEDIENVIDSDDFERLQKFALIFPGTKWCGAGNIADGYDDLGSAKDTDMCCRDHDNCDDVILAGDTKYNLTNNAYFTRLHCDCDENFRQCLHAANSKISSTIGKMYFNALGTKCYRKDYPIVGCNKTGGWLNKKCKEYEFDTNGEQRYQWFDVPNY